MVPVATVMTFLWLVSQAVAALQDHGVSRASSNAQLQSSEDTKGLSVGALVGIIVGSALGGLLLLVFLALLSRCLCQRRQVSSNPEKPGPPSEAKATRSSGGKWFRRGQRASGGSRRAPTPPLFGSDKMDPDEISDTSFVLPELGGPNPHNKFDGMEWVDIKGMDDDVLVEISTDLRKYQQRP